MDDGESLSALVIATAERIFHGLCNPRDRRSSVNGEPDSALWRAIEDAGMPLCWVTEARGGSGLSVKDGFELLALAGRFALPVPLAETMLAAWLLDRAGLAVPEGMLTIAPAFGGEPVQVDTASRLDGAARGVPYAAWAAHLAVLGERGGRPVLALVRRADAEIAPGRSLAGEPKDDVRFVDAPSVALAELPDGFGRDELMLMSAAMRARQMAGALAAVLDLAVQYARERIAFEKPIGRFQAVQHNLARLAGEVAAAEAASRSAADAIASADFRDDAVFLEVAAAKIRVGEAAGLGAAIAHQVHGAMGFTEEHHLHLLTRRLWAWRDDFGSESEWAVKLGHRMAARGADGLWPLVASR